MYENCSIRNVNFVYNLIMWTRKRYKTQWGAFHSDTSDTQSALTIGLWNTDYAQLWGLLSFSVNQSDGIENCIKLVTV